MAHSLETSAPGWEPSTKQWLFLGDEILASFIGDFMGSYRIIEVI